MRVGNGLVKLVGLCLLAGVLVAGMLFPTVGALGVVSNRASDTVDATSADLVTTDPPLMSVVEDRNGKRQADRVPLPAVPRQHAVRPDRAGDEGGDRRHRGPALLPALRRRLAGHLPRAADHQVNGSVSQGASTITQQYVKNYQVLVAGRDDKAAQEQAQAQTVARKLKEARVSLQLEKKLSKDEILTRYLNLVTFLGRVDGVGTAAQVFFNTTPDKLTLPQAALLAGVVNNPVSFSRGTTRRPPSSAATRSSTPWSRPARSPPTSRPRPRRPTWASAPSRSCPAPAASASPPRTASTATTCRATCRRPASPPTSCRPRGYVIKTNLDPDISKIAKQAVEHNVPKTANGIANTMVIVKPGTQTHDIVAWWPTGTWAWTRRRGRP
ncbi:transglycosylase domain-containing protein [Kutzneria kofuensis]|uniref:transglycosylase domain-containing protein n=1 Tax=Kutzneria kofuensis TaxID=103725 RepID=UPI003CD05376